MNFGTHQARVLEAVRLEDREPESFAGDGVSMRTVAADGGHLLDNGHRATKFGGLHSRTFATGASPDHDDVELMTSQ